MYAENVIPLPPANVEAELTVLGGLMRHPEAFEIVAEVLTKDDFYVSAHREIYAAMQRCVEKGNPTDRFYVEQELGDRLAKAGGKNKLQDLTYSAFTAVNIEHLARLIRQKAQLRELISIANQMIDGAMEISAEPKNVIETCQQRLSEVRIGETERIRPFADILVDTYAELQESNTMDDEAVRQTVSTGMYDLDDCLLGGLRLKCLTVIGGRGGLGKSTFAIDLAAKACESGTPTAFFALEMSATQVARKVIANIGGGKLKTSQLFQENGITPGDWRFVGDAIEKAAEFPLWVQDASALSLSGIRADLRKIEAQHGHVKLVIVDYVQLLHLDAGSYGGNRVTEVDYILKGLRAIAKDFNCAVVGMAQLSRAVEGRADKRPLQSDFRESGAFEQEAAYMLGLYRDDYYNAASPDRGIVEVSVLKARFGKQGVVKLLVDQDSGQYKNLAKDANHGKI